ncbi:MAG: PAS domain-containing protein, partial [Balneolaceae bacterium]
VISTDEDFNIKSWNLAAEKNYGWNEKEAIGKKIGDLIKTKYSGTTEKEVFEILPEKGEWNGEVVQYNKDGSPLWILSSIKLQTDKDGEITGIITVNRDITQLKKQQIELKKNRDQLVEAQNTARMGYWELDLEANDLIWSDSIYNIFGLDKSEFDLNYRSFMELVHPEDREELALTQKKAKETGRLEVTYRVIKPDGTIGYFQERGEILNGRNGKKKLFRGVVLDVTSIKKMEVKLEEEQKRFEIAANITSDVIWEWDKSSNVLWWGDGIETVLGYSKKDFENNPTFWQDHIHPDDKERVVKSMNEAENSFDVNFWQEEYSFRAADGQYRFIKDKGEIIRDGSGEIKRIIGAMVDVTKEIEYQKTLREERNRFEMIAKSSNDVLYDWDIKKDRVWWSEGWQTRFEFKPEDIEQTLDWWVKRIHPSEIEEVEKSLDHAVKSGKSFWSEEYRFLNGKNFYSNVVDKGYFIKDSDGKNTHLVGTITDITTETKAKYELRASEEQYRLLFQLSPIPMWIYDPKTLQLKIANNAALDKYGYSLKEVQSMKLYELHPESDHEEVLKEIRKSLKQAKTGFDVWTHETKSGDKLIVEISGSSIFYEGKTNRLILTNDITKQRKAEERTISSVVEGEERERQRISKELHDGLGQYLSASNMNLETVYEDLTDISPKLKKSFKTGLELLNHAILETQTISQNLLPKAIQDYGLNLAVDSLINQLDNSHSIKFHLYKNINGIDIPEKLQINLYRILQESLNNAIRHGKPEKVDVQIVFSNGELLLTIEDNGDGFDTENVTGEGLGLRSIKSRVAAMSANLDISSAIGRGTIISVIVPVEV